MIYTVYAKDNDMTFIMKNVKSENIESLECVGWYFGKPCEDLTKSFEGKLKAEFVNEGKCQPETYSTGGGCWETSIKDGDIEYYIDNLFPRCLCWRKGETEGWDDVKTAEEKEIYNALLDQMKSDSKEYGFKIYWD